MSSIGTQAARKWRTDSSEIGILTPDTTVAAIEYNTKTFQSILDGGGSLSITAPGTYQFNTVQQIPSNTDIYVGAGVTLKCANGAHSALFTNAAARSTGVAVLAANASYATAPDGNNFCIVISNMTAANAALFPVNSYVSVVVLGHAALGAAGTAWAGRGYRGVRRVVECTINGATSSIKYLTDNVYPGSAPSSNNLTIYRADENITLWGPGIIDGNGSLAAQTYFAGDPRATVLWWRHLYGITVAGPRFKRGVTWTIGSNYVRNYTVRDVGYELRNTPNFAAVDLIHLVGQHQKVDILGLEGGSADNAVGLTIDCTEGTAYDWPYQSPGDMYDVTIKSAYSESVSEDGTFGIIGIYGPAAYIYRNLVIDGVSGIGSSAVQLANYPPTNQNKLTIDRIAISNVRSFSGSAQVELTAASVFDIGEMILENIYTPREDVPAVRFYDTATGNIRSLVLRNVNTTPYDLTAFTRTAPLARFGGMNINALQISNTETMALAINIKGFAADGPGNIPKVGIRDCSATGTGTAHLWGDTGGGTAAAPVYNNSTYNAVAL